MPRKEIIDRIEKPALTDGRRIEDRLADAHRDSELDIVAYTIDDRLRAAIRIAEDNAPGDVCLFREHCRNLIRQPACAIARRRPTSAASALSGIRRPAANSGTLSFAPLSASPQLRWKATF